VNKAADNVRKGKDMSYKIIRIKHMYETGGMDLHNFSVMHLSTDRELKDKK